MDAAIVNGASSALRVLSLREGTGSAPRGSGVIGHCVFKTDALDPSAIGVGDSRDLTINGTITVQNSDFPGVDPDCAPICVTPSDVNATKGSSVKNVMYTGIRWRAQQAPRWRQAAPGRPLRVLLVHSFYYPRGGDSVHALRIPRQAEQSFHAKPNTDSGKPNTDSTPSRTVCEPRVEPVAGP